MNPTPPRSRRLVRSTRIAGFISSYAIYGVGLMAVLSVGVAAMTSNQAQARATAQARQDLASQSNLIRNKLLGCALLRTSGTSMAASNEYPMADRDNPGLQDVELARLNCMEDTLPASGQRGNLWTMGDAISPPLAPSMFTPWHYVRTETEAYAYITARVPSDVIAQDAMQSVVNKLGASAARVQNGQLRIYLKG